MSMKINIVKLVLLSFSLAAFYSSACLASDVELAETKQRDERVLLFVGVPSDQAAMSIVDLDEHALAQPASRFAWHSLLEKYCTTDTLIFVCVVGLGVSAVAAATAGPVECFQPWCNGTFSFWLDHDSRFCNDEYPMSKVCAASFKCLDNET